MTVTTPPQTTREDNDVIQQWQIDELEKIFAETDEAPAKTVFWQRCLNWSTNKARMAPARTRLKTLPRLREAVLGLPDDSYIIVDSEDQTWFTQAGRMSNVWAIECSTRLNGQSHIRSFSKYDGSQWTAHEIFLIMAQFIRDQRMPGEFNSTLMVY